MAEDPRIKDQLASLVVYATMCRAAGEAAMVNATKTEDGNMLPSPLFVSALKYFKSEFRRAGCSIFNTTSPATYS